MTRRTQLLGAGVSAAVTISLVALSPNAQGAPRPRPSHAPQERVHQDVRHGLTGRSAQSPGQVVKGFLRQHGRSAAVTASLTPTTKAWTTRGVTHLRLGQVVSGLRVYGVEAKASVRRDGSLVSLIENAVPVSQPVAASIGAGRARQAAVGHLYPHGAPAWATAPSVDKVAIPTKGHGLEEAYVVTTWTARTNQLVETVVSGGGRVVSSENRSASDSYNIFPEDPGKSGQVTVTDPADNDGSPQGWLAGPQRSVNISGNNVHAYLDTDNDNAADPGGAPIDGGGFLSVFDATVSPSIGDNRPVAVQNLFYLDNLIHDTLWRAGFTEAAGNFQADNLGRGGKAGDPVQAEAQDGGGTDNANFATPHDGQPPRMQMYLWTPYGKYQVQVESPTGVGPFDAAGAEFGPEPTKTGISGGLTLVDDGSNVTDTPGDPSGTVTDACTTVPNMTGIALVDRGGCTFVAKARSVQAAGATAMVVVTNTAAQPSTMGGTDSTITIPAIEVSQSDGDALKTVAATTGNSVTVHQTDVPQHDGDLDSDIVWHEYGHGLTWRMIGRMDGPLAGAIGEGMSDVLSEVINNDPVVGEYAGSNPAGIRSHSYEGYDRTYGDIVGSEVHLDGEVYGAIGWSLWKHYRDELGMDEAGARSAILADLVDGMNYTPATPTYEEMRDGILAGLTASSDGGDRSCMVWDSFAQYGVGVGALGKVTGKRATVRESFAVPTACQ